MSLITIRQKHDVLCYSYPLINMPLPGNTPLQFVTPVDGYKIPPSLSLTDVQESTDGDVKIPRWVRLCSSATVEYHLPVCGLIGCKIVCLSQILLCLHKIPISQYFLFVN